jgi:hypothetical protein
MYFRGPIYCQLVEKILKGKDKKVANVKEKGERKEERGKKKRGKWEAKG